MWTRPVQATAVLLLLLLCGLRAGLAFNMHPQLHGAVVFSPPPGRASSGGYFGYTVALATVQESPWLIVSAPRANSSYEPPQFRRSGALFRCPPAGGECKEMRLIQGVSDSGEELPIHINNGTLGGSMDALLGNNGMVVCNPSFKDLQGTVLGMPGLCYWLFGMTTDESEEVPRRRLKNGVADGEYNLNGERWKDENGTPQMGFSVHQLKAESRQLLVGGPGLFGGRGTVALYIHDDIDALKLENYGIAVPSLDTSSYFGYSVTAGRFESSSTLYVGGAPRAEYLRGKVIVFDYKNLTKDIDVTIINIKKELNGEQIGEYFGASLAAADINNDGLDELLVGAPLHTEGTGGDEGKVYLYSSSGKNENEILDVKQEIVPKVRVSNGRFGTAIGVLGDIDKDGYTDIAIGAPYENSERGAVYIYYGSSESPYLRHERCIKATDLNTNLKGFGFSFSRGGDIDSNAYNDLSIGAYLSDHAVILRTSPVLRFNSSVKIDTENNKIPMYGDKVLLSVCVRPNELLEDTGVSVTLNIDPVFNRGFISNKRIFSYNLNMTAKNLRDECKQFQMTLKNNTKIFKPVEIEISYKILHPKPKNEQFCKTCPILDFKSPKSHHYIHYQTNCAGEICKTNFMLTGNFTGIRSPFIIGTNNTNSVEMVLVVANSLEASYETNISITFPSAIKLRQSHQSCYKAKSNSTNLTSLICEVPYILSKTSKPYSLNVHFDMDSVPWDINQLQVNISVEGSGEEQYEADNTMTLDLELQHIANVSIKGRSSPPDTIQFAVKRNDSEDYIYYDRTFIHTYTIVNNGPSPVHGLHLKFMIPYKLKDGGRDITYLNVIPIAPHPVSLESPGERTFSEEAVSEKLRNRHYLNLDCSLPEVECLVVHYNINDTLSAKHGLSVTFNITSLLKELGPLLKQSGVYVRTQGTIENEFIWNQDLGDKTYFTAETETFLSGRIISQESVQDWIIIVAVICGILILIILCVVLWKLGFFKRNKPPSSEEAETEKPDTADKVDTDPLYEDNP